MTLSPFANNIRNHICRAGLLPLAFAAVLVPAGPAARAQTYNVSLDTSKLTAGDTYALDFQLNQGSTANAVSTVNVANFLFGGGSATGAPTASVNATGSLTGPTGVTLSTSATAPQSASFTQNATLGSTLSFTANGSQFSDPGATNPPDGFLFDLFDVTTNQPVTTTDPNGTNALFTEQNNGAANGGFAATGYSYTGANGPVMTQVTAAPELGTPVSFGLLLGLFGLGLLRARRSGGRARG